MLIQRCFNVGNVWSTLKQWHVPAGMTNTWYVSSLDNHKQPLSPKLWRVDCNHQHIRMLRVTILCVCNNLWGHRILHEKWIYSGKLDNQFLCQKSWWLVIVMCVYKCVVLSDVTIFWFQSNLLSAGCATLHVPSTLLTLAVVGVRLLIEPSVGHHHHVRLVVRFVCLLHCWCLSVCFCW